MSSTAMPGNPEAEAAGRVSQEGGVREQPGAGACIDDYRLLKKLGDSGMGAVYLAEDTLSPAKAKVVVRVLSKEHAQDAEFLARFRSEAEAAINLRHPNIVSSLAVRESRAGIEAGAYYYVMEYCEGVTLAELIRSEGFLSCSEAITVVMQVARGLQYAHEHKFVHRYIRPANICIPPRGEAKVMDMGVPKDTPGHGQAQPTVDGQPQGLPYYVSPEQALGVKRLDHRTDIYSLGATFYHMLTGRPPFEGESPASIVAKHVTEPAPNPQVLRPEIPDALSQVVQKMMAKELSARHRDCTALLAELQPISHSQLPMKPSTESAQAVLAERRQREQADARFVAQVRRCVKYTAIAAGVALVLWVSWLALKDKLGYQEPDLKKRQEISILRKAAEMSMERQDWREAKDKFGKIVELTEPEMLRDPVMQQEHRHATQEAQKLAAKLEWEENKHAEDKLKGKQEEEDKKKAAELAAAEKKRKEMETEALAAAEKQRKEKEAAELAAAEKQSKEKEAAALAAAEKQRKEKEAAELAAAEKQRQEKEAADRVAQEEQRKQAQKKRDALRAECINPAQTGLAALERIEKKAAGGAPYQQCIEVYQMEWPRVQRFLDMPELKKLRQELKDGVAEALWKDITAAGESLVKGQGDWREKIQAAKEKDFDREAWDGEVFGHIDDARSALAKFKKME